ncbi:molybdate ABC transporter substrate-binding protein [Scytonema sp. UIC 10036]|uniref:molybdate ABC transporter substrate-binding protein n=1 Tax=Scytonema sp. UIC 10036 TaxID=2304196 RepID=UPI0012DAF1D1|nr:molybdate ABC transporter substrate-binding protein [Scytonema sp. UIC 10036]MUH01411.1 molybdate ABC transporter substrate-binding protein [Scytonema sp. UIC 10036]
MKYSFYLSLAIFSIILVSCRKQEAKTISLNVSAGQSLQPAMTEIKKIYTQQQPNVSIAYKFSNGGSLKDSIVQGETIDIFFTGGSEFLDDLQSKGFLLEETRKHLLNNKLVLIVSQNSTGISTFKDLSGKKVKTIAVGDFKTTSSGQHAEKILNSLKILDLVKPKLVFTKVGFGADLFVEMRQADAGIMYATDAIKANQIKIAAIAPENSHSPSRYSVAVLKASKHIPEAKEFIQFLESNQASAVFVKYGFAIARDEEARK